MWCEHKLQATEYQIVSLNAHALTSIKSASTLKMNKTVYFYHTPLLTNITPFPHGTAPPCICFSLVHVSCMDCISWNTGDWNSWGKKLQNLSETGQMHSVGLRDTQAVELNRLETGSILEKNYATENPACVCVWRHAARGQRMIVFTSMFSALLLTFGNR